MNVFHLNNYPLILRDQGGVSHLPAWIKPQLSHLLVCDLAWVI